MSMEWATTLPLIAFHKADNDDLFVHINTTTFVVNFIHKDTLQIDLRQGTLSIINLLYVLLPLVAGQVVVQMRVPKTSLGGRLQAQGQLVLCR